MRSYCPSVRARPTRVFGPGYYVSYPPMYRGNNPSFSPGYYELGNYGYTSPAYSMCYGISAPGYFGPSYFTYRRSPAYFTTTTTHRRIRRN